MLLILLCIIQLWNSIRFFIWWTLCSISHLILRSIKIDTMINIELWFIWMCAVCMCAFHRSKLNSQRRFIGFLGNWKRFPFPFKFLSIIHTRGYRHLFRCWILGFYFWKLIKLFNVLLFHYGIIIVPHPHVKC